VVSDSIARPGVFSRFALPIDNRTSYSRFPVHIVHKSRHGLGVFDSDRDYRRYLRLLIYNKRRFKFDLLAYCILPNAVHLIVDLNGRDRAIAPMMTVQIARHAYTTDGKDADPLYYWEPGVRLARLQPGRLLLSAFRAVERLPLLGCRVSAPDHYPWSSWAAHAEGRGLAGVNLGPEYLSLGSTPEQRAEQYRALMFKELGARRWAFLQVADRAQLLARF